MSEKYKWKNLKKIPPMRRLFDRWMPEALTMMGAIKILQFLRILGVKATSNGWRKVTSIFLRGESSKFILTGFRLNPDSQALFPAPDTKTAARRLAAKLAAYLRITDAIGYWVQPGKLAFIRRKRRFRDLLLVEVDSMGMIVKLIPYFDGSYREFEKESSLLNEVMEYLTYEFNRLRDLPEQERAVVLQQNIRKWSRRVSRFYYFGRRRRRYIAGRLLHSTVLFCEFLPELPPESVKHERFQIPDFRKYRNPGLGMMAVLARFTADLKEVDLWCQFNHVATDGLPMQEFLSKLKRDWGAVGELEFPRAIKSNIMGNVQLRHAGEGDFRALFFADFQPLLAVRTYLNEHYTEQMNGPATVAGLIMWGLSRHETFSRRKILLPVDAGMHDGDRHLGLLMIRPQMFTRNSADPISDFCKFQSEMHRRMDQARTGGGAVSEFLELCALMHPLFYLVARKLWPRALDEVLGTAGLSILRDAEIFIAPTTEFQSGGFIAVGNVSVPDGSGGTSGAVSIAGTRKQIRSCLEALHRLPQELPIMLDLPGRMEFEQSKGAKYE